MTEQAFKPWGPWFGDFATGAAAKRYLTMNFTGPKVSDNARWKGEVRAKDEGRWEVRLAELDDDDEIGGWWKANATA